jgi:divalent metal cation (Fe/Co/Zn/Cd) transporter
MAANGRKAILAAFFANLGIAVAKFVGFFFTGAASMLAEAIHSVADTNNQALLLLGARRALEEANPIHPFGYGRARYSATHTVVLLEALGALVGLGIAFVGVMLAAITHDARYDTMGSVAIGVLWCVIGGFLAVELKSLLMGRPPPPRCWRGGSSASRSTPRSAG